jgi:DNA modification methylase
MKAYAKYQVESRKTRDLVPYARNARTHSEAQVAQIAASIREFGFTNPILIDVGGGIIAGHGRVLAALSLGLAEVPCIALAHLTEAQKRAYVLADNKLALNAGWDEARLVEELRALDEIGMDLALIGFDEDELADLFANGAKAGLTDPDAVPETPAVPVTVPGVTWVLGVHRVTCGDATKLEDVERALGHGAKADACWTDPPYNVAYAGHVGSARDAIANDQQSDSKFYDFLLSAFSCANTVLKPGAAVYVAHADTEGLNFRAAFIGAGFKLSGCLVWAKNSLVMGRSDYQWQHEPILYGWKRGAAHRWFGGRKVTTLMELPGSVFTQNEDGTVTVRIGMESIVISGRDLQATPVEPTIFHVARPSASSSHPTMKPVELISRMVKNSTREGDLVLDPFGGSGSTLIACETLGRQARLLELEPKFVDVIVRRWQEFTGKTAVRESDGQPFEVSLHASARKETKTDTPEPDRRKPRKAPAQQAGAAARG